MEYQDIAYFSKWRDCMDYIPSITFHDLVYFTYLFFTWLRLLTKVGVLTITVNIESPKEIPGMV